ncbi:MAG: hypothetical protein R3E83_22180 [Burkholderiaceae bacterium]
MHGQQQYVAGITQSHQARAHQGRGPEVERLGDEGSLDRLQRVGLDQTGIDHQRQLDSLVQDEAWFAFVLSERHPKYVVVRGERSECARKRGDIDLAVNVDTLRDRIRRAAAADFVDQP